MTSGRVEHIQYLREGEVRATEIEPGLWVVRWRPHRRDHPDYPEITTDSQRESMPTEGGADAVLAWAVERFETHDERIVAEVMLEEESREGEVEAIEALFDEEGVPSVVTARIGRRSAGPLPWTLLIEAPIGVFLTTLAARAAGDAYEPLKRLVQRVFELRRRPDRPDGSIQLEENGRTVILTDKIPDEDSHRRLAPRMRPRGATRCGGEREPGAPPGSGRSRPATPRIRTRLAAQAQAQAKTQLSGSGPDLTPHLVVETVKLACGTAVAPTGPHLAR